ncbi:MAG TPA: 5-(carboxyamino)imidazole ribonucleotide mutase, partial [Candidatus Sumerlaeota bacterium]|nr:5-(carboxyamino)imidazole ribonucleotide mutase [Candidatus Sumerlaeota bacterium]
MGEPAIGIIIGSKSDWHLVEKALEAVAELNLRCAARIASAHRTPEAVMRWIKEAEEAGVQVFVAVAGMAAALPGVVSAQTLLPVIGVPVEADALRGQDALYSIVQMP